jgi:hypothetical protein
MRHHPTFDGALMAQNSLRHHHRAPTPWGGGAAHRHYPHWRWRTDGGLGCQRCVIAVAALFPQRGDRLPARQSKSPMNYAAE